MGRHSNNNSITVCSICKDFNATIRHSHDNSERELRRKGKPGLGLERPIS